MVEEPGKDAEASGLEIDPVESLYGELDILVESLKHDVGTASNAITVSEISSKALLMAAASSFEAEFSRMFEEVAMELGSSYLANFGLNQGVKRKFHTLFEWGSNNANGFFKLFGEEFKERAMERAKEDPDFSASIGEFIRIGRDRNELVHSDFAAFPLTHTLQELIDRYRVARRFLPTIKELLLSAEESPGQSED